MKVVSLTKIALAGGLLLGQTQPVERFYEDDEDFNLASAVLMEGWNWGINKASAADECTNNESTSAEQCLEVIEIEGEYDPTGELSLYEPLESGIYDGIEPTPTSSGGAIEHEMEDYIEVTDCLSQTQQDYIQCINDVTEIFNTDNYRCYKRYATEQKMYAQCLETVSKIYDIDTQMCDAIKQDDIQQCP